jgi:hypothetical protein
MHRPPRTVPQPGEPRVTLYSAEWQKGMYEIKAMPEPERRHYRAFFEHLETGWLIVRTLQLAAEALLYGHSPDDDVANWIDVEITDNFRWLAFACLQMIPSFRILPELGDRAPFGPEPPVDELEPESQMLGRNVRLLAMMEGAAGFPQAFRGMVGPAASAFTAWERELPTIAAPVVAYVVSRTE